MTVLDAVDAQDAAVEEVDHAARRADDDLRAPFEPRNLRRHRRTAVHGHEPDAPVADDPGDLAGHLARQLARGHEDDCLNVAVGPVDPLGQRNAEPRRLARAGLRLAHQVHAVQHRPDHGLLNGRGLRVAHLGERLGHRRRHHDGPKRRFARLRPGHALDARRRRGLAGGLPPPALTPLGRGVGLIGEESGGRVGGSDGRSGGGSAVACAAARTAGARGGLGLRAGRGGRGSVGGFGGRGRRSRNQTREEFLEHVVLY